MSISDNYVPDVSAGNGVTVAFSGSWNVIAAAYMVVQLQNTSTLAFTPLTLGTDYTLVFTSSGYTITCNVAPVTGYNIIRSRNIAKTQIVPYRTSTGFQGLVEENSFDKITAITQDLQENVNRTLLFPIGTTASGMLPVPQDGYGLVWSGTNGTLVNTTSSLALLEAQAAALAAIEAQIVIVAGISSSVTDVAGNAANINTVAGISSSVSTVASISASITTVAGISANITSVAGNATNINTVANNIANVNATGSNISNVNSVAADLTNIDAVAADLTNINACAADLPAINAAPAAAAAAQSAVVALANMWDYSNTTAMSNPGTGNFRLDNSSFASVANIAISASSADIGNPNLHGYLITWANSTHNPKGIIRLVKNSTNFAIFGINGSLTDNTSWVQIPITLISSVGSFTSTDAIETSFTPYGNDGTGTGTVTTSGTVTTGKLAAFSGSTAITTALAAANSKILGSGATGSGAAYSELTLGTNLSISGTTLNATGGGATSINGLSDAYYDTATDFNLVLGSKPIIASGANKNIGIGQGVFGGTFVSGADGNTAIGYEAMSALTSGNSNTAVGSNTLNSITTGGVNIAIGSSALFFLSSGTNNIAIGPQAMSASTNDTNNVVIGKSALSSANGSSDNVAIGYQAGASGSNNLTTGTNNIFIGSTCGAGSATATNRIAMGYTAQCLADNTIQMGNASCIGMTVGTSNNASVKALNTSKVWATVTGATGARVLADSYGSTGVTDGGTGIISIVHTTNFANVNYCPQALTEMTSATFTIANARSVNIYTGGKAIGSCELVCTDKSTTTNAVKDPLSWTYSAEGKQ